jgi:hypothetical protein
MLAHLHAGDTACAVLMRMGFDELLCPLDFCGIIRSPCKSQSARVNCQEDHID